MLLQHLHIQHQEEEGPAAAPPPVNVKPRPILVDKQFTSEPATPTSAGLNPNKPMHRNLSDLSQRIKKRVTYRCLSLHDPPKRNLHRFATSGNHALSSASDGQSASQGNPGHPNPPPADPGLLRPDPPLSAPPLTGTKTFGEYEGCEGAEANPEHSPPDRSVESARDRSSCPTSSSEPHSHSALPLGSDDPFVQPSLPVVTSSCVAGTVLSTLNEQKSIESDCSLPFMDGSTSSSSENSSGSKKSDSCNGSPHMSTPTPMPTVRIENESDSGGGNSSGSRTDLTAVPALESLTDFHVGCDVSKLKTTC